MKLITVPIFESTCRGVANSIEGWRNLLCGLRAIDFTMSGDHQEMMDLVEKNDRGGDDFSPCTRNFPRFSSSSMTQVADSGLHEHDTSPMQEMIVDVFSFALGGCKWIDPA